MTYLMRLNQINFGIITPEKDEPSGLNTYSAKHLCLPMENSKHRFSFICGPLFSTPESFFNFPWRFKLSGVDDISPVKIASMQASTSGARPSFQLYEARDLETISPWKICGLHLFHKLNPFGMPSIRLQPGRATRGYVKDCWHNRSV